MDEIKEALQECKIIREYIKDKPLKSYLTLGFTNSKRPLHIVVALDVNAKYIWVISVYEPNKEKWDETFTKRLK